MDPNGSETQVMIECIGGRCDGVVFDFLRAYGKHPKAGDVVVHYRRGEKQQHLYQVEDGVGGNLVAVYRGAELVECTGK